MNKLIWFLTKTVEIDGARTVDPTDIISQMEHQKSALALENYLSFLFTIVVVVLLVIKFKRTDKKTGIKGSGSLKFLKSLFYYFLAVTIIVPFLHNIGSSWQIQIFVLAIPIGVMLSCDSYGFIDVITKMVGGALFGAFLLLCLQLFRLFGVTDMTIVVRIVSGLLCVCAFFAIRGSDFYRWKNDQQIQRELIYDLQYRAEKEKQQAGLFDKDVTVETDFFGNKKFKRGNEVIATSKIGLFGDEQIYNSKGEKWYTVDYDLLGNKKYKDNNGTAYREEVGITGDHYVTDKNYKRVSKTDSLLDSIRGKRSYKKK